MKLLIISQFWSFPEKIPALGKTGQEMGIRTIDEYAGNADILNRLTEPGV